MEFEREISSLFPSAEAFEHFLWGFWWQRISEVFAVDQDYLGELQHSLTNVHLCKFIQYLIHVPLLIFFLLAGLPSVVRYLFDLDFDLIKYTIKTTVEGTIEYHTEEGGRDGFDGAFFPS